jgi:ATP-dependent Clp endopeptidase proteolytic subunit ClpP
VGNDDIYVENYRLLSKLGSGAFGNVYKAQHAILTNRIVAVKLMRPDHAESEEAMIRFLTESQILEKLKHPYILPIIDVGIHHGLPYLVTEYAPKGSLRDRLQRQVSRPLSIAEALTILTQIGQALQYAHDQNIIHRDLKPENILFNEKGDALVADFGIATTLDTSSIKQTNALGTYQYMAPEEYDDLICKESDQYALGCIAYELFTGHLPFQASSIAAMIAKHLAEQPTPPRKYNPELPEDIEKAILKVLAKQRESRYVDVSSFIKALQYALVLQAQYNDAKQNSTNLIRRLLDERIIFIGKPIDDSIANQAIRQLLYLQSQDATKDIWLYINSPGGIIYPSLAVYDMMQWVKPDIVTVCVGVAAGSAALLLSAGKKGKRYAVAKSLIRLLPMSIGNKNQDDSTARELERLKGTMWMQLACQTGQSLESIARDMDSSICLTAKEAVSYGIIDDLLEQPN